MKLNKLILSCMLLTCLKNYNIDLIDSLFSYGNHIRAEAAARVAQEEARIYAAKIAAEENKIAKETADGIVATAKLIYKTGLFGCRLFKNPNRTCDLLKNGDKDTWIGCIGFSSCMIGLIIAYKAHKKNEEARIRADAIKKHEEESSKRERENQTPAPTAPQSQDENYEQPGLYPTF